MRQLTQPIILYFANQTTFTKLFCVNSTNWYYFTTSINIQKKKKISQIDNNPNFKMNKDNPNIKNAYYINNGFEKLLVNFIEIKSIYNYCSTFFQSCLSLYRHIGASYKSQYTIKSTNINSTFSFPRLILIFTANLIASSSNLIFKG